jgi:hypothetical protein
MKSLAGAGRSLILDTGYWMFLDTTAGPIQDIRYRETSIQHQLGEANDLKKICNVSTDTPAL